MNQLPERLPSLVRPFPTAKSGKAPAGTSQARQTKIASWGLEPQSQKYLPGSKRPFGEDYTEPQQKEGLTPVVVVKGDPGATNTSTFEPL